MEKIIVKQKRLPFFMLFLGTLIFVVGCMAIIINHESLYYKIIGIIGVVFFGFGLFLFGKNFIKPKTILKIEENGIFNLSRYDLMEFIPWSDIVNFSIDKIAFRNGRDMNHFLISINLEDENKYIDKAEGMQKKVMIASKNLGYSMFSINLTGADRKRNDVLLILNEYLLRCKK